MYGKFSSPRTFSSLLRGPRARMTDEGEKCWNSYWPRGIIDICRRESRTRLVSRNVGKMGLNRNRILLHKIWRNVVVRRVIKVGIPPYQSPRPGDVSKRGKRWEIHRKVSCRKILNFDSRWNLYASRVIQCSSTRWCLRTVILLTFIEYRTETERRECRRGRGGSRNSTITSIRITTAASMRVCTRRRRDLLCSCNTACSLRQIRGCCGMRRMTWVSAPSILITSIWILSYHSSSHTNIREVYSEIHIIHSIIYFKVSKRPPLYKRQSILQYKQYR